MPAPISTSQAYARWRGAAPELFTGADDKHGRGEYEMSHAGRSIVADPSGDYQIARANARLA
jgi:hypothetical protein